MNDPSNDDSRYLRTSTGLSVVTALLFWILVPGNCTSEQVSDGQYMRTQMVYSPQPLIVLAGSWLLFTGIAWLVWRNPRRRVARYVHAELRFDVFARRRPPDRVEVYLARADVPGAAKPWNTSALPADSVRGRLARHLTGDDLFVEPKYICRRVPATDCDETTIDVVAADMVLLARCCADDDGPALQWLTAPHRSPIVEHFAVLLLEHAPHSSAAAAVAQREIGSHSMHLRMLANLHLGHWSALAALRAESPQPEAELLARAARAADLSPDPSALGFLLALWPLQLTPHLRTWLRGALARHDRLNAALEAGLAANDATAVKLSINWHTRHHGPEALLARCVTLLEREGDGPPVIEPTDPRPALWLAQLGRAGSTPLLPLLRRWATAVGPDGHPAEEVRLAAEAAALRLSEALPAGGGGLSVVGDAALGGLAVADEVEAKGAGPAPVGEG